MRATIAIATIAFAMPAAAIAGDGSKGEVGYMRGALGYDALVAGNNDVAVRQILATKGASRFDPARMINLGQAYARLGRTDDARALFAAVLKQPRQDDLLLAGGELVDSHSAARRALGSLEMRVAAR